MEMSETVLIALIGAAGGVIVGLIKTWIDNRNTDRHTELEETNAEFAILRGVIDEMRKDLDAERAKRRSLNDRQLVSESDLREAQQKIRALESERRDMSRRLLKYESDCAAKDTQLTAYQTEISALNTQLAVHKVQATKMQEQISCMESKIDELCKILEENGIRLPPGCEEEKADG